MSNRDHLNDNQGQGGTKGRFATGDNKPGGRHVEEDGSEGVDHLKGTNDADVMDGLGGDDVIVGRGGDDMLTGGEGNDTFSHSGIGAGTEEDPGDGLDTIIDFEAATEVEGEEGPEWEVADRVEIDADSFDFSAVNGDGVVDAAELLAYVQVTDGVIEVDLDGAGAGSEFEAIVDTSLGAADDGVAVEIDGTTFVWSADAWVEV
ncbi:MAG: hypothetical protein OEN23_00380 [Paracoccaceae bacterium]|nr:hypothetical protein [Paracoccaceae bacterium]